MLDKKTLNSKIIEMVVGDMNMQKRNKLQQLIINHYNDMIDSYTSRITNRLDGLNFNYIFEKSYDEEFTRYYTITMPRINLEIRISKNSLKNDIIKPEFENMELLKVLVNVHDECNQNDLEYKECRRIIKGVYKHIANKLDMELSEVREMSSEELFDLYELNYRY